MIQSIPNGNSFLEQIMETRQVQYFISIVEAGSFSAAADELYISQSLLSKQIMALEKELGVTLFDRSKRKISLTDAGEAFLKHARKLNSAYKNMSVELTTFKANADSLSIAAIPVLTEYGITTQIAQFRELYPDIHVALQELNGFNILPSLNDHLFDLAITRHNYLNPNRFASIEICRDKLLVVVSPKNRHAGRSSISIKELSEDNFIVFDKVTDLHKLIMDECEKAGFDPIIFYSSHRKVGVFGLVGANIGLALMPAKIYDYHRHQDVLAIPLDENIECDIVLVYLKNRKLPKSAKTFIDFIQKACKQPGAKVL
jgi:LysR family transcriptional activator of glutamate synthase operon